MFREAYDNLSRIYEKFGSDGVRILAELFEAKSLSVIKIYFCSNCLESGFAIDYQGLLSFGATGIYPIPDPHEFIQNDEKYCNDTYDLCDHGKITTIEMSYQQYLKLLEVLIDNLQPSPSNPEKLEEAIVYASIILASKGLAKSKTDENIDELLKKAKEFDPKLFDEVYQLVQTFL